MYMDLMFSKYPGILSARSWKYAVYETTIFVLLYSVNRITNKSMMQEYKTPASISCNAVDQTVCQNTMEIWMKLQVQWGTLVDNLKIKSINKRTPSRIYPFLTAVIVNSKYSINKEVLVCLWTANKGQRVTAICLSITQHGVLPGLGLMKPSDSCTEWDMNSVVHLLWITRLCSKTTFSVGLCRIKHFGVSLL